LSGSTQCLAIAHKPCYNFTKGSNEPGIDGEDDQAEESGPGRRGEPSSPGSETERFQAIVDVRHNEAVTGESGVPANQRDHELRRQMRSLEEFS
jgi:hypothetical protein